MSKGHACALDVISDEIEHRWSKIAGFAGLKNGAEGRTRTGTDRSTRPSTVRVYQFRHFGTHINHF